MLYSESSLVCAFKLPPCRENLASRQRQQTYYGYSFESWCTSSRPGIPERILGHPIGWGGDVDTNVQWCSVIKTKLGENRLVIGGEVDCVRGQFTGSAIPPTAELPA